MTGSKPQPHGPIPRPRPQDCWLSARALLRRAVAGVLIAAFVVMSAGAGLAYHSVLAGDGANPAAGAMMSYSYGHPDCHRSPSQICLAGSLCVVAGLVDTGTPGHADGARRFAPAGFDVPPGFGTHPPERPPTRFPQA